MLPEGKIHLCGQVPSLTPHTKSHVTCLMEGKACASTPTYAFTTQDTVCTSADPQSLRRPSTTRLTLSRLFLCMIMLFISVAQTNTPFNITAAYGNATIHWDSHTFTYYPPQNVVTMQNCTNPALDCMLQAHINRLAHTSDLNTAYYRTSDNVQLGGVDWPFVTMAGARIAVCHTGIIACTLAFFTTCRYARVDNNFYRPTTNDVVCDVLHTANGHAIAHLNLPANIVAKHDQNVKVAVAAVLSLVAGTYTLLHSRHRRPGTTPVGKVHG